MDLFSCTQRFGKCHAQDVSKGNPELNCSCCLFQTNELQKKIKDRTQKLMALVAELSMKQALAIKLQQEMRDKEQFFMTVSSRIDQGLPPPKETENEWLKVLRNEKMQKAAAEARAKVSFCCNIAIRSSAPPFHCSSLST